MLHLSLSSLRDLTGDEISTIEDAIKSAWNDEPAAGDNWATGTMYLWKYVDEVWQWALCTITGF